MYQNQRFPPPFHNAATFVRWMVREELPQSGTRNYERNTWAQPLLGSLLAPWPQQTRVHKTQQMPRVEAGRGVCEAGDRILMRGAGMVGALTARGPTVSQCPQRWASPVAIAIGLPLCTNVKRSKGRLFIHSPEGSILRLAYTVQHKIYIYVCIYICIYINYYGFHKS